MRLLLDAHVSSRNVGRPLARRGHDARALADDATVEGLDDEQVLAFSTAEQRILVTHDVVHFPAILREWAIAGRSHAGVIVVYGIGTAEFRLVVDGITRLLQERPEQIDWVDINEVLSRGRFES